MGPDAGDGERASLTYEPDLASDGFGRVWIAGERFSELPPATLRATIEPGDGGRLLEFYEVPLPVMSSALKDFFQEAGVDNIDFYPVVIVDVESGSSRSDYFAFNIIGLVAAADMGNSSFEDFDGLIMFDSITIDSRRTAGARLFRMAEAPSKIVAHKSIKSLAEARNLQAFRFHPIEVSI